MSETLLEEQAIETEAGTYQVRWYSDPDAGQPEDEGFGLVRVGDREYIDIVTDAEHADEVASLIRHHQYQNARNGNIYDHEVRSAAAIARYVQIKYGLKGVVEINNRFSASEKPSADRGQSFAGLAWAPEDVDGIHRYAYVRGTLQQWHAWAEGDTFGWVLVGPDGEEVDAVWGYYGFWDGGERAYTLEFATEEAQADAKNRADRTNLVGSGIIGLI